MADTYQRAVREYSYRTRSSARENAFGINQIGRVGIRHDNEAADAIISSEFALAQMTAGPLPRLPDGRILGPSGDLVKKHDFFATGSFLSPAGIPFTIGITSPDPARFRTRAIERQFP